MQVKRSLDASDRSFDVSKTFALCSPSEGKKGGFWRRLLASSQPRTAVQTALRSSPPASL